MESKAKVLFNYLQVRSYANWRLKQVACWKISRVWYMLVEEMCVCVRSQVEVHLRGLGKYSEGKWTISEE